MEYQYINNMEYRQVYVDIREEHELLEKYLVSDNENILVVSIPMRVIFANLDWMNHFSKKCDIIFVCRSGHRSKLVKDFYFSNNTKIFVLEGGIEHIKDHPIEGIKIVYGKGGYGLQQYLKLMFAAILTIILVLVVLDFQYTKYIIIGFIMMILYQVIVKKCYLNEMLPFPQFINSNI